MIAFARGSEPRTPKTLDGIRTRIWLQPYLGLGERHPGVHDLFDVDGPPENARERVLHHLPHVLVPILCGDPELEGRDQGYGVV